MLPDPVWSLGEEAVIGLLVRAVTVAVRVREVVRVRVAGHPAAAGFLDVWENFHSVIVRNQQPVPRAAQLSGC